MSEMKLTLPPQCNCIAKVSYIIRRMHQIKAGSHEICNIHPHVRLPHVQSVEQQRFPVCNACIRAWGSECV